MALFQWRRNRTSTPAVVASAARIQLEERKPKPYKPREWQTQAWDYFDVLGEIKYPFTFLADAGSKVRLFVGWKDEPDQDPTPINEAVGAGGPSQQVADLAVELLSQFRAESGGQRELQRRLLVNLGVPGEGYINGREDAGGDTQGDGPIFDVYSVDQVQMRSGKLQVRDEPGLTGKGRPIDADELLARVWQPHPRFPKLADSSVRGVLDDCQELVLLHAGNRAVLRSRISSGGIVYVSNDLSFPVRPDRQRDPKADPFLAEFMDSMLTPIGNPDDASAVVPIVVRGEGANSGKVEYIEIRRPLDGEYTEREQEIVRRIARGLAIPAEQLLGLGDVNHWTAWQVEESTFEAHVEPPVIVMVEAITGIYQRPMLLDAGVPPDVVDRIVVWYDPSELVIQADRSQVAGEAHDRLTISDATYRRELGYDDDDAPDEEEIERRMAQRRGILTAQITEELLRRTIAPDFPETGEGAPSNGAGGGGTPAAPAGDGQGPPEDGPGEEAPPSNGASANGARMAAFAAQGRLDGIGGELAEIDRALLDRLTVAADSAMLDALRRAGSRVRSAAQGQAAARDALRGVPSERAAATLGDRVVAVLGVDVDEALEDSFDQLGSRFDRAVARAQDAALRAVVLAARDAGTPIPSDDLATIRDQQEQDRAEGWLLLLAALFALARTRLFDPDAAAPPDGEFDEDVVVPPGAVRSALARAGGAVGSIEPGGAVAVAGAAGVEPALGVATGPRLDSLLRAAARAERAGWVWRYGDPSARSRPFPPHQALNGRTFERFTDDALTPPEAAAWIQTFTGGLYPGDHAGCLCQFEPLYRPVGD